jgi:Dyp-type peroxidase family
VQGLVTYGYRHLPNGKYLLLKVEDPSAARKWILDLTSQITISDKNPQDKALNIAFTAPGLLRLGATHEGIASFIDSFGEGIAQPHRLRILGDFGPNAPSEWKWGYSPETTPDLLLMLFAPTEAQAQSDAEALLQAATGCRLMTDASFEAHLPGDGGDHFGFQDGIAQPRIAGAPKADGTFHDGEIAVGEFLVGQPNQRGQLQPVPTLMLKGEAGGNEFGRNGTYLVYRQMNQDPVEFHYFCSSFEAFPPDRVGSWLVGRWPDGTPLAISPDAPKPETKLTDFGFGDDPMGRKCPIGAHIRRANPRDGLRSQDDQPSESERQTSLETVSHHRILRRGRMYGTMWRPGDPAPDPNDERGLHFICLNANTESQFEQIQQAWLSNPKFLGLYDEVDPMVGIGPEKGGACKFTIPQPPGEFRHRLDGIPRFIKVRGGAYFFMPTVKAIRLLSELG